MKNVTNFINTIKTDKPDLTSYDLFEIVKDNEKMLKTLCDAVIQTYDDIEHIKKFL